MALCQENYYNSNAHVTTLIKQRFEREWNWQLGKVRTPISFICDGNWKFGRFAREIVVISGFGYLTLLTCSDYKFKKL